MCSQLGLGTKKGFLMKTNGITVVKDSPVCRSKFNAKKPDYSQYDTKMYFLMCKIVLFALIIISNRINH